MKILFSLDNRVGAAVQMARLLPKLSQRHQIKIAAHASTAISHLPRVDWNLDALHYPYSTLVNYKFWLNEQCRPRVAADAAEVLRQEIAKFAPDLIISDWEDVGVACALDLKIPFWYVSPLNFLNSIDYYIYAFPRGSYTHYLGKFPIAWPAAEKTYILGPWGRFNSWTVRPGVEWLQAETQEWSVGTDPTQVHVWINNSKRVAFWEKIQENLDFKINLATPESYHQAGEAASAWISGETSFVSDAIQSGITHISITPQIGDWEQMLNAQILSFLQRGLDLRQTEKMDRYAINFLTDAHRYPLTYVPGTLPNYPTLSEIL